MYTHTFQIKFNGVNIEGEFFVDEKGEMHFSTEAGETMTVNQHEDVQRILKAIKVICNDCDILDKISVDKK